MKRGAAILMATFIMSMGSQAEGVKILRMEKGRAVFEVGSGTYEFDAAVN